jgi:hypothetical protein
VSQAAFPLGVFLAVAALIALLAFGLAQVASGAGVIFVITASVAWTAYAASRSSKRQVRNG